ncbi:MAG: alpha/beta hydrolase [Bifidobacteriaceae bacterium]|nr:alpha/beta hydrolase [Bifidobacteriaceae bacterium]
MRAGWPAAAALGLVAALALAACSQEPLEQAPPETRRASPSLVDDVWTQEVVWERCTVASGAECATVAAPLDWADPAGDKIELALARVKASGPGDRLGSLLVNPGGPGGSGQAFLASAAGSISPEVLERYDLVGFDPRGVGDSSPVTCYKTTEELDQFFAATWPRTPQGYEESLAVVEPFAQACAQNTGPALGHVDTVSAAKDLDLLRAVLGDEQLNFLGYSYGTLLGATYAELFPSRVGRLVLDGAIDPSVPPDQHEVQQAAGFEAALAAYLGDCLGRDTCPFNGTKAQALTAIHQFLLDVEAEPMPTEPEDGRDLTLPLALNGILVTLYDDAAWSTLSTALIWAMDYDDPSALMMLSDAYLDRVAGRYQSNQMEAFVAINCLDGRLASDQASAEAHAAALKEASPTFGEFWAYSEKQCEVWPYPQVGAAQAVSAAGAGPIIVVGTTGDPATPYQGAVALASQLESGVLVTFEGEGHTAYGRSNDCVDAAINGYFLQGVVPEDGLTC